MRGMAADVALYPSSRPERAGAQWDLHASLLLCSPPRAGHIVALDHQRPKWLGERGIVSTFSNVRRSFSGC